MKKGIIIILLLSILLVGCSNVAVVPDDTIVKTIDYFNNNLYDGKSFYVSETYTINPSTPLYIALNTKEKVDNFFIDIDSSENVYVRIYENANTLSDGSDILTYNFNRNVNINSTISIKKNCSIVDTGFLIFKKGDIETDNFKFNFIPKKNTKYLLEISTIKNQDMIVDLYFYWIEK